MRRRQGTPLTLCAGARPAEKTEQVPEIRHGGATLIYRVQVATHDSADEVQAAINDVASECGTNLAFTKLEGTGQAQTGAGVIPALSIVGVVNTDDTPEQLVARMQVVLTSRLEWQGGTFHANQLTADDAARVWVKFWQDIKDEVHRKSEDGQTVRVVPGGSTRGPS